MLLFVCGNASSTAFNMTILAGNYYPDAYDIPYFNGFRDGNQSVSVVLDPSTSSYVVTEFPGKNCMCESSWNKLFGASRCGYLWPHHEDSDRFVWRRLLTSWECGANDTVLTPSTPPLPQIELAAYAYDDGNLPYQNSSLLTVFSTKVTVGVQFNLRIEYLPTSSVYTLLDGRGSLLETHTINHRYCDEYEHGYNLYFYFGGECTFTTPSEIFVDYSNNIGRK